MNRSPAELTGKQRRHLRALAHHLEPAIQVGHGGLSQGVIDELDRTLETHELIKLRVGAECPLDPGEAAQIIEQKARCHVAQVIGRVLIVYRRREEEPSIELPKPGRDRD